MSVVITLTVHCCQICTSRLPRGIVGGVGSVDRRAGAGGRRRRGGRARAPAPDEEDADFTTGADRQVLWGAATTLALQGNNSYNNTRV